LAARLAVFRRFGWWKFYLACVISAGVATAGLLQAPRLDAFAVMIWAFALPLGPQISGADREFLRLELDLRWLNLITLCQKSVLLVGTGVALVAFDSAPAALAAAAVISAISSGMLGRWRSRARLRQEGATPAALSGTAGTASWKTLGDAFRTFSLWAHLSGVIGNWVQTLDLLLLGALGVSARELGLYGTTLKLANFSQLLPAAASNWASVGFSRGEGGAPARNGRFARWMVALAVALILQAVVLRAIAPWGLTLLSRGRWSVGESQRMSHWISWMLTGSAAYGLGLPLYGFLLVRGEVRALLFEVFLPWCGMAAVIYFAAIHGAGLDGAAAANLPVGAIFVTLTVILAWRNLRSIRGADV
jgi:hypothetical protein